MPIDSTKIEAEIKAGACFICAMCRNFHRGKDLGFRKITGESKCTSPVCCGPIGGGTFEDYSGDLTNGAIAARCYICGDPSDHVIKPKGSNDAPVGVCSEHLKWVKTMCSMRQKSGTVIILMISDVLAPEDKWEKK